MNLRNENTKTNRMKWWKLPIMAVFVGAMLVGCSPKKDENAVNIVDGDFAEMKLFAQIAKIMVEEHTDYKAVVYNAMAMTLAFDEIKKGNYDMTMSYDGTLLATFLVTDASAVPAGQSLYDFTNEKAKNEANVMLLDKLGFENTYAIAVDGELADRKNLTKVSDLRPIAKDLVFATEHQFFDEEGTIRFNPFIRFYDLAFKDSKSIDIGLKYAGMQSGNMDVTMVYGSDGLNKKFDLRVLEDDMKFFPEYYGAYMVRADFFEDFPELEAVFAKLKGKFPIETAIDLNYQIDVDDKDPYDVAYDFLKGAGLID